MAKRKPKHLAPVAATQSDIHHGLARIIELATKWQAILQWTQTLKAAKDFRRYRCEVWVSSGMISGNGRDERRLRALLAAGTLSKAERRRSENELAVIQKWNEEQYEQTRADMHRCRALAEERYEQVTAAQQELLELQHLVRQHEPTLLECAPDVDFGVCSKNEVDFFLDPPEVDHSPLRRDLRKLEGQARVLTLGVEAVDQTTQNGGTVPHKGISLLDAALLANEGDSDAAKETKKRWANNRDPKLPKPMGKADGHSQMNLFDPVELLDKFVAIVEPNSLHKVRSGYKKHLQTVKKTV